MGRKFLLLAAALILRLETVDCAARGEIKFYKYYDSYDDCDYSWLGGWSDCDFFFRNVKISSNGNVLFHRGSTSFTQDSQTYYPSVTATVDLPSNLNVYLSMEVWDKDVKYDDHIRTMSNMALTFENTIIGHSYSTTYRSGGGRLTVYYRLLSCNPGFTGTGCADCILNYYGSQCSTYCKPVSGSYTCDSNGRKTCVGKKVGSDCQDCQSNYYPDGQCDTFCDPQPGIYTCSSLGLRVLEDCVAGQSLDQSTGCQPCPADEWSLAANAASTCTACPAGKGVAAGSGTSQSACTWKDCVAGQSLDQSTGCQPCPADEWSLAANAASTCTACPAGKGVAAGSGTSQSACTWKDCVAGQSLDQSTGCQPCPADEWSLAANAASTCTACPAGKGAAAGSGTSQSACTWKDCVAGQSLDQSTGCQPCPADEWSLAANAASTCTACPAGKGVAAGSGTSQSACTWKDCVAGQSLDQSTGCQPCPADEWSLAANAASTCTACPAGKGVAAGSGTSQSACTWKDCVAGQYLDQSSGCQACPADQWSLAANAASTCTACPADKEVASGSGTQESACTWKDCVAGQYLDQSSGCQACPADQWSLAANAASTCTACPADKEVASGSGTQESDCTWKDCVAGQYLDQSSGCQACPADQWSLAANAASTCTACPADKEVASGSGTQESDCTWKDCVAGQYLDQSSGCQACPADQWSLAANAASTCTACPADKEVASGSGTQESDCTWRYVCPEGQTKCGDIDECVPNSGLCNGGPACSNGFDESAEFCTSFECPVEQQKCADGIQCFPSSGKCDKFKIPHCNDKSDDVGCTCKESEMVCADGNGCASLQRKCDGSTQCADGSDESRDICYVSGSGVCGIGTKKCATGNQCIAKGTMCDGSIQCLDGSDEDPAFCPAYECPAAKKKCADGIQCVPKKLFCNGKAECTDGSDESEEECAEEKGGGKSDIERRKGKGKQTIEKGERVKEVTDQESRRGPPEPEDPEPVVPVDPEPVVPVDPEPVVPVDPEPVVPVDPVPVVSVDPEPVVPVDPEPVVPVDPEPVVPEDPEPVVPVDPEPVVPVDPEPVVPVDPEPVVPEDPEPVFPVDPEPVVPEDPEPVVPVDLEPVVPVDPEPVVPVDPEPVVPVDPEPVVPEDPEPVVPEDPEPVVPVDPEPVVPVDPEPVVPMDPEPVVPVDPEPVVPVDPEPVVPVDPEPVVPEDPEPVVPVDPEPVVPVDPEPVVPVDPEPVVPVDPEPVVPEDPEPVVPVDPEPVVPVVLVDPVPVVPDGKKTCDCWTPECGFCSNPECSVKLTGGLASSKGIGVRSFLHNRKVKTIVMYNSDGDSIGQFEWSLKRISMSGCFRCQTPEGIRDKVKGLPVGTVGWSFAINDGVVELSVEGEILFTSKLTRQCAEVYGDVKSFSFTGMSCKGSFAYASEEMKLATICGGADKCPVNA
ncbi:uncharacterized protein LOC134824899 isoform X2 [Bolinopsis microptera]|uniref:uncharacterized protein LOC134824899 isoform X2 n=1 Tax=Bolinopsis microptera TaxID=2820187 RepID=UPI003079B11C